MAAAVSATPIAQKSKKDRDTLKISLNTYSFNKLLNDASRGRGEGVTLLQLVDFAAYERALRDGRAVIMVHVRGDAPKAAAHEILKRHGGHFINYYGRFATEELDLWRGPEPDIPGYLRR